jgi:serine/threonine protein kinase
LSDDFSEYRILKAKDRETGEFVMIKEINRQIIDENPINKKIFIKELELMQRLKSDCFVKLIDFYQSDSQYLIVTEYFEGRILENFLSSKKQLSENLVQQILRKLVPAFKELDSQGIVLDFISTKSFCFKYFKNEDNFAIKFFDYGLGSIFTDIASQRDYLLNEAKFGHVNSVKTNVLSMGMVIYKLLFGETIYKFSLDEEPEVTMAKSKNKNLTLEKSIKLSKNISRSCKHLIEKTCHLNKEKRYDWKNFLSDSFITIKYNEDIRISSNEPKSSYNITLDEMTLINDYKVENLAESLKDKTEFIIKYYQNLFDDSNHDDLLLGNVNKFLKEISFFTMYSLIEIKLFQQFLTPKETFYFDEELHIIKLTKTDYDYCSCNFVNNKIYINKENPMIENYLKTFQGLEANLLEIIKLVLKKLGVNIDESQAVDYLQDSMKNTYHANLEHYFFDVFEKGLFHFSNNNHKDALNELLLSKYYLETVIFVRIIVNNKPETIRFFDIFDCIENDDEINLFSEIKKKNKNWQVNFDNLILFTFIGGVMKSFKEKKILESEITSDTLLANSHNAIDSLVKFYADIIKMVIECSKPTI